MMIRSPSPDVLQEWDIVSNENEKIERLNIEVVICSCTSHISSNDIHVFNTSVPRALITVTSLQRLRSLTFSYLPIPQAVEEIHSWVQQNRLKERVAKYMRNPMKFFGLAGRGEVKVQRILSVRFVFNVTCVILWVLVRKFLEIFGVRFSAFEMVTDDQKPRIVRGLSREK